MDALAIIKMVANGVQIAAATSNNDMVKKGAGIVAALANTLALGKELDGEIAERARAFAKSVKDDLKIDEDDFEKVARDLSDALDRWDAAG